MTLWFVLLAEFVLLGAAAPPRAKATPEPIVILTDNVTQVNLTSQISLLPDPEMKYRIEDFLAPGAPDRFQPCNASSVNLGFSNKPVWVRITVRNASAITEWVLDIDNPRLAETDFYFPGPGNAYTIRQMGTQYPKSNRDFLFPSPAFRMTLAKESANTFYLRLRHSGSLRFHVKMRPAVSFEKHAQYWIALVFTIEGILLIMAIQGLFIFAGIREKSYFLYSILLLSFWFMHVASYGTAHLFFWPNCHWWIDHCVTFICAFMYISALVFSNVFLHGARYAPRLSRFMNLLVVASLLQAVLSLTTDSTIKYYTGHILGLILPTSILLMALLAAYQGFRPARTFLLAWSILALSAIIMVLLGAGFLPSNRFTEHAVNFAVLTSLLLWSFSLTNRIRIHEEDARRTLEKTVAERTKELRQAVAEVKSLHGLLPICSRCKKIRDDRGYWQNLESYLSEHTGADFSHSICPNCLHDLYPEYRDESPENHQHS